MIPLSPSLRRIRFELPGAADPSSSGDPDERVLVEFGEATENGADGGDGGPLHRRSYTVRARNHAERTLDIDFAVHAGGAAAGWARTASPGDPIRLSAAKGWWRPPPRARRLLLLADLTALPAAGRIVESLPAERTLHVVAEVPDAADAQHWDSAADVTVTWLTGTGNGASPSALPDALAALPGLDGVDYLWSCGESGASRRIRGLLRHTVGLPTERYHVMGYWQADKERWLTRYAEVEAQIEELTACQLAAGRSLDEVRDAIDDALTRAGL